MSADVDALPDMLTRLKLTALRGRLDGLLDEAARGDLSLRETLALLCRAEVSHREERRIQMGTGMRSSRISARWKRSTLPPSPRWTPSRYAIWPRAAGWPTATRC